MLSHSLQRDDGILVLRPEGPLEKADFVALSAQVDAYLENSAALRGVLICASSLPGWRDFGALLAHLKFIKDHVQRIEKVAVVAGGAFANIMPSVVSHFVHAEVRHFDPENEDAALAWLRQTGGEQLRSAA
jgi:hypothetical protein